MNHRKNKHSDTVAFCRNFCEGNCTYSDEMCWWNHNKKQDETIKCFICSNTFDSKTLLMKHRKKDHHNLIKPCTQFKQNNCRFRSESCWFKHEEDVTEDVIENKENTNSKKVEESQKVFQKVSEDLYPPIVEQQKNIEKEQNL